MKALSIAFKDLQVFFRDRGAVLQAILLPLAFIVVFSGVLGAIGQGEEDTRIPLPVVDLDGGESAHALLASLDGAGGLRVERYEQAEALALLDEQEIERVLTIPAGFNSSTVEGRTVTLRLVSHPDADLEETEAVRLVVEGVAQDMSLEKQILAALRQMGEMQAGQDEEEAAFSIERTQAQARSQFKRARTEPLVAVSEVIPRQEEDEDGAPSIASVAVPGFAVLFVFLTGQTTARSVYDEKKAGSFRRLLAAPMSKATILAGKMLPNFIIGLIQMGIILGFGVVGLDLLGLQPTSLGEDPLAVALVGVLVALCSSAIGIAIAAIARTENQIGGLSTLLLWGLGILGGSIIPTFVLDQFLGPVPRVVPHYWANRALENLMVRGADLADVTAEIGALFGFTALFVVIGLWRFEFD
ncbi:MAG: ABC transporter permease [Anaerolineae bacterium]|jgi:ABC-2 type transport system permease protein